MGSHHDRERKKCAKLELAARLVILGAGLCQSSFIPPNQRLVAILPINRSDLEDVMMGKVTFDEQIKNGKAKLEGDRKVYNQLKSTLIQFDPLFEIMRGTKGTVVGEVDDAPFEQSVPYVGE